MAQAGRDPRVMLVTTVKDEGPNILEWIGYHRMIGFTDIVVFQNDSFDTTARSLRLLDDLGVIRYFDNRFRRPGRRDFQNRAYRRAARLDAFAEADWCMALDGDEFLRVNVGQGRVQDLLAEVGPADEVRLNWRVFGSSHLRELDDRIVTERFTMANEITLPSRHPMPVKTLFRTDAYGRAGIHLPRHPLREEDRVIVNGSGRRIEDVTVRGFQVTDPEPYLLAQVNHYMVKDSDSFLMKSARGSSSHPDRQIALDYWRKRNVNHEADLALAGLREAIADEMRSLDARASGLLVRLRNKALRAWRARIAHIKAHPDGMALWEQLV